LGFKQALMLETARSGKMWLFGLAAVVFVGISAGGSYVWWTEHYRSVSFTDLSSEPVMLIDDLRSYARIEDVASHFKSRAVDYEVRIPPPRLLDGRPPFEVATLIVPSFTHYGLRGRLIVAFFNDRLVDARFFPTDLASYLREFSAREGLDLQPTAGVVRNKHTRIWTSTDSEGSRYVGWEDLRLVEEMMLWIKRYS
jgi:hypothetical protein